MSLDVFEAVSDDLVVREAIGFAQHKRPLSADEPGRDWLTDAYEEALDMAVYLKAELMRREERLRKAQGITSGMVLPSPPEWPAERWPSSPQKFALAVVATTTTILAIVGGVQCL